MPHSIKDLMRSCAGHVDNYCEVMDIVAASLYTGPAMAIDRPKGVNIVRDVFLLLATRREAQLTAILLVIALFCALVACSALSRRIESARAKANAELELERQQAQIEKEQERLKARQISEKEQYLRSLYRFPPKSSQHTTVALAIDSDEIASSLRGQFASSLAALLNHEPTSKQISSDILLPGFYSEGFFERAFSGDTGFLDDTRFYENANGLLLVSPRVRIAQSETVDGVRSCQLGLSLRLVSNGQETRSLEIGSAGIGFSAEASLKKAFENIQPEQTSRIKALLE